MGNKKQGIEKLLLNKRFLGLLLRSRTRNLIKIMKDGNIFFHSIDKFPDKDAIIIDEKKFTYKELKERINRLNNGLRSIGLKGGDHICCFLKNSNEILEIVFGSSLAGFRSTPINWHLTSEEIEYIINNSDSKVFFVEDEFLERIIPIKSRLEKLKQIIVIGNRVPEGMISYEKFLKDSSSKDLASFVRGGGFMLYTSGTTGRPKGTHSRAMDDPSILDPDDIVNFVYALNNLMYGFDFQKTTNRHIVVGPLYHAAPLGFAGFTLAQNGTIIIMKKFDPEETLRLIQKEKISTSFMVPIILKRIMEVEGKEKYDVSSMKSLVCAAAPCPAELKKRVVKFFGPIFFEFYGSTDAQINFILRPEHYMNDEGKYASVGKITVGNRAEVLDEEGRVLPPGEIGDLHIANTMVKHLEYYNDPEKTRNSFRNVNGLNFFIEGEVAYLDKEGFCYIVDRKKDLIISGGVNIYPFEIEEVIQKHPDVSDVAVIGVPDDEWGESVMACIVQKAGKKITADEIIALCSEHLAGYKRPKVIDFVEEIPRRIDGKLMKRDLRKKYAVAKD